ncbi:MAG: MBL fold metallo-hydrolase [Apibacter sp.]|nr:MBL fold metallo-hydrolase [Apibacter sp.]
MFDTGTGDINGKGRKLFDVLFRVSIKPEPITDIVITHGHLDYIRGLVRGNKPTFSNAVVYLKKEHEF